jgi:hypothetical protein
MPRSVTEHRHVLGLAAVGAGIFALMLAAPRLHAAWGDLPFNAVALAQGGLCMMAVPLATRVPARTALMLILLAGLAMRIPPMLEYPFLSTDAFRYVWDGRVQGQGINPYRYIPAAPELAFLRDALIYPNINRADYAVTIYPPAAQMLFFVIGRVGDSLANIRIWFVVLEGATIWLLIDLLRRIGQPVQRIVAWAWHPLAIWEIAGSAHIDGPMVTTAVLGIWLVAVVRRPVLGAAAIAAAAMMKPLAALALPFAWRPWDWRAPVVAVAVVVLVYLPYLSVGTGMFAFAGGYAQEESLSDGNAFWLVLLARQVFGPAPWIVPLYLAGGLALLGVLALRLSFADNDDLALRLRRLGWLVFAGLFFLSSGYPWYYLSALPFVVLFGTPAFWATTIGAFLLYDLIPDDASIRFWIRDAAHSTAMIGGMIYAVWSARRART